MDFEKIINWAVKYLAEYISVITSTLQNPTIQFKPIEKRKSKKKSTNKEQANSTLNPKLLSFVFISIIIGATLNSAIPRRPASAEIFTTAIITLTIWLVYSLLIFWMAKLAGGKGKLLSTLTIGLQLLGTIYVVSNIIAFLWGLLTNIPILSTILGGRALLGLFIANPLAIFYFVQLALMAIYLPLAIKPIHDLDFQRVTFVTVIAVVFIFLCGFGAFLPIILNSNPNNFLAYWFPNLVSTPLATEIPTVTFSPTLSPSYTPQLISYTNSPASSTAITSTVTPSTPTVKGVVATPTNRDNPGDVSTPTPTSTKIVVVFTPPTATDTQFVVVFTPPTATDTQFVVVFTDTPSPTPTKRNPKECEDGIDNDGDGFIDLADPQCAGGNDNHENK